jgi:hypothetical protein
MQGTKQRIFLLWVMQKMKNVLKEQWMHGLFSGLKLGVNKRIRFENRIFAMIYRIICINVKCDLEKATEMLNLLWKIN